MCIRDRVTNIANTIDSLKDEGLWIAAADMDGQEMYDIDLKGSLGLVTVSYTHLDVYKRQA